MNSIDRIFENLQQGYHYGYFMTNARFPMFSTVMCLSPDGKYIRWQHFGSSANSATKNDLQWIIETIFNLSPETFEKNYLMKMED